MPTASRELQGPLLRLLRLVPLGPLLFLIPLAGLRHRSLGPGIRSRLEQDLDTGSKDLKGLVEPRYHFRAEAKAHLENLESAQAAGGHEPVVQVPRQQARLGMARQRTHHVVVAQPAMGIKVQSQGWPLGAGCPGYRVSRGTRESDVSSIDVPLYLGQGRLPGC
jgi:hypothetical protein